MRRVQLLLIILLASLGSVYGQGVKYGIKAGLNFSKLLGPSELNVDDDNRESTRFAPGFHLGPVFNYEFSDRVGLQVELLYSQKGSKYRFLSDSAYFKQFLEEDGTLRVYRDDIWATGRKETLLNINSGYLSIPVSIFFNATPNFRVGLGIETDILLHATGTGQTKMTSATIQSGTNSGVTVDNFSVILDHKYNKDDPGFPEYTDSDVSEITVTRNEMQFSLVDKLHRPQVLGAYPFEEEGSKPSMFSTVDLNANLDLAYIFNSGLYFNVRTSYGLLDATDNDLDYSKQSLTDPENGDLSRIKRADKDVNFSVQVSVGFNF